MEKKPRRNGSEQEGGTKPKSRRIKGMVEGWGRMKSWRNHVLLEPKNPYGDVFRIRGRRLSEAE